MNNTMPALLDDMQKCIFIKMASSCDWSTNILYKVQNKLQEYLSNAKRNLLQISILNRQFKNIWSH